MNARLLLPLALLFAQAAAAQLLPQLTLDSVNTYHDLAKALKQPDQVYRLDLSGKKLKEVPEEVRQFKNLNALDLGHNKLRSLPDWMGELVYMQEFRAGQNKLTEVPKAVCQWKNLRRLDLHMNALQGLPACMGALDKVEVMDLWSNDLSDYPDDLSGMASVKFIDLRVIQYEQEEMEHITALFPRAKIYFSQPCNCGHP